MEPRQSRPVARAVLAALLALLLAGCATLPPLDGRSVSRALADTGGTRLGQRVQALRAAHAPGESGLLMLPGGGDAFATRVLLADAAERSLDVQYYLWRDDLSGALLFEALERAAARGVRVRLLLDDAHTPDIEPRLARLAARANVEVRLFNPFATRRWRALGALFDFGRVNRRMHNKSFTADNQATVIGGRNVGDEYFGATPALQFTDLDVLAVGPVVAQVSDDFDRYWASDSAYPLQRLLPPGAAAAPAPRERAAGEPGAQAYLDAVAASRFVRELLEDGGPAFDWAPTELVSDDPAKALARAGPDGHLVQRLTRQLELPQRELLLVSSYFVPGEQGTRLLAGLARRGVKVAVMTNSLEATDVAAVHAGYARWRRPLLEAGVELYEMKRTAAPPEARRRLGSSGSASSLHAKVAAADRAHVFVGSFNFDPRSAQLNTELGFVIHSPALAARMAGQFAHYAPLVAYRVQLGADGALRWVERHDDGAPPTLHDTEPRSSLWRRLAVRVLSWLPIDGLL